MCLYLLVIKVVGVYLIFFFFEINIVYFVVLLFSGYFKCILGIGYS